MSGYYGSFGKGEPVFNREDKFIIRRLLCHNDNPSGGVNTLPNSNLALISLIAGILGLTIFPLIGSIVALVIGYMAKKEIQESMGSLGGDGMVKAGIILGWIGIGLGVVSICIVGVIIAIPLCLIPMGILSENSFGFFLALASII